MRVLLPLPKLDGGMSVEEALAKRRSIKHLKFKFFLDKPMSVKQLGQLLWAAQGINDVERGFRTAPSAGRSYPLKLYVFIGDKSVKRNKEEYVPAGIYIYEPLIHALALVKRGDHREELAEGIITGYNKKLVVSAPVSIAVFANYEKMKYKGENGVRYVILEVGHMAQNVYLQAVSLGMGTLAIGAFHKELVKKAAKAEPEEDPIYILPVGLCSETHTLSLEELRAYYRVQREK